MKALTLRSLVWLALVFASLPLHAAISFSVSMPSPSPAAFDMGTTSAGTFRVSNTNTGGTTDRITSIRFRLNNGDRFSNTTVAPSGWSYTLANGNQTITLTTTFANGIQSGSFVDFPIVMTFTSSTADLSQTVRDARATFTSTAGATSNLTINNPISYVLKSLQITSFQTTDASGTAISALAAGGSFELRITVLNRSTAVQSGVVANPNPPTRTRTGTWGATSPSCTLTSGTLTLGANASGTLIYVCTTLSTDSGTVTFSVTNVRNSTGNATSRAGTSNTLSVSPVTVQMSITPTCLFSGSTATMTLTIMNNSGATISNVVSSGFNVTTSAGASISALTGPTNDATNPCPTGAATLANGAFCRYHRTATVTGVVNASSPKPSITASSAASYSIGGSTATTPTASATEDVDDYVVSVSPASVNASSTNVALQWTVTNRGCGNNINVVAATVPGGWTLIDSYSLVTDTTSASTEWGTGPTFIAPNAAARVPIGNDGAFEVVVSTPAAAGSGTFTLQVSDDAVPVRTVTKSPAIIVNSFNSGSPNPNATSPGLSRETFR